MKTRPLLASTHFTSVAAQSKPTNKHKRVHERFHVAATRMPPPANFHSVLGW